ncbi:DUF2185 domain-containing protein [Pontibacter lucknowensis]|uniref:Immunity protein Imm33 domain-containing protein n=1 Tax=Pontibacter lucknowensis TaxID=1077936 RepID=A0A1N6ZJ72_9BACT|nr:DUF2185 domain-containing protein [Pontibacter lucknowensis]SIR26875.1 hypothetical protein SAMN05421545_3023 [Pontibacter lucknowensis]
MKTKKFKLEAGQIVQLIAPMGGCIASDKITVEGLPVAYMYREEPEFEHDSGWRFFSGTETQEYADNSNNLAIYDVNTIANYDPTIIPYLELEEGVELERTEATDKFIVIEE